MSLSSSSASRQHGYIHVTGPTPPDWSRLGLAHPAHSVRFTAVLTTTAAAAAVAAGGWRGAAAATAAAVIDRWLSNRAGRRVWGWGGWRRRHRRRRPRSTAVDRGCCGDPAECRRVEWAAATHPPTQTVTSWPTTGTRRPLTVGGEVKFESHRNSSICRPLRWQLEPFIGVEMDMEWNGWKWGTIYENIMD